MKASNISTFIAVFIPTVLFAAVAKEFNSEIYVDAERGMSIASYSTYELCQGVLRFGYYLNDPKIKSKRTLREIFPNAVEGDTVAMGLPTNRTEYVFTFYDGDNQRHWLTTKAMALADDKELLFGEVEYSRYQNVTSSFTLAGASLFPPNKEGNKALINGRLHTQGFLKNPEVVRLSILKRVLPIPLPPPDSRDPRRFYIYLKDGTKAIAAKYPDAGDRFFSSGITWRRLFIDDESIVKFGIIDDGAFGQSLCLPKSEVDAISGRFFSSDDYSFWNGFIRDVCGGFADTKHPWRSLIYKGVALLPFLFLPWIGKLIYKKAILFCKGVCGKKKNRSKKESKGE